MTYRLQRTAFALTALALGLAGCGGSGGNTGVVSTPPPPPVSTLPPTLAGDTSVELLQSPSAQEFAVAGTGDPLRIRYDAESGQYQVLAGGGDWTALIDDPFSAPLSGAPNRMFIFASRSDWPNGSFFGTRAHHRLSEPDLQYRYSNLAGWSLRTAGPMEDQVQRGTIAFGAATPPGAVPVAGTGTYRGIIEGSSTVTYFDQLVGREDADYVTGTVTLRFDFAGGTLSGEMRPRLEVHRIDLGTLAFADTVFGVGSRSFSGRFATSAAGTNLFSGLFTGPNAEELIGQWAFPFVYAADGSTRSASGAWIAKRGD